MTRGIWAGILALAVAVVPLRASWAQADPAPAMNHTDQVSWSLFTKIMAPAGDRVRFETWASDADTFAEPPRWPDSAPSEKKLHARILTEKKPTATGQRKSAAAASQIGIAEEVHRNQPAFRFIVDNRLYDEEGLAKAFAAGRPIVFPVDAVEVKADWVRAEGSGRDASLYYAYTAPDHTKYLLVSVHISSKQVPSWTWATFEHEDNPGRCDTLGCRDGFGAKAAWVAPHPGNPGRRYPDCDKSAAVLEIFKQNDVAEVFRHYCLKGSQTDFVDPTGLPTRLGSSVTEYGFINTASCITCHARAAFDRNGRNVFDMGLLNAAHNPVSCPTGAPCSPNGAPLPRWFWSNPNSPQQSHTALQADFVWSIPFCAIPKGKTAGRCS